MLISKRAASPSARSENISNHRWQASMALIAQIKPLK